MTFLLCLSAAEFAEDVYSQLNLYAHILRRQGRENIA